MKKQTPIQELIIFLESEIKNLKQSDAEEDKNVSNYLYAVILSTTRKLLEKEKQAIIDAYYMSDKSKFEEDGETYFNNKYNTK